MRIDNIVTSGVFCLDGGSWEVDNNVWLFGDDREVVVVDAAHDAQAIAEAAGHRDVTAIMCTHGHNDHINAAVDLADLTGAPILLNPDDMVLWRMTYSDREPDQPLLDGDLFTIAGQEVRVLHTPGHAPGAVCLYLPEQATVFSGDTLFQGGPGATGRSYSDYPTITNSIRQRLFALPDETTVNTGHGDSTTIGAERAGSTDWE